MDTHVSEDRMHGVSPEACTSLRELVGYLASRGLTFESRPTAAGETAASVTPETVVAGLTTGRGPALQVRGGDLREALPIRGLEEVRVLDALYGTHNLFGMKHAALAVALDHFAALGLRLGLQEGQASPATPASLYDLYQQYDRPRGAPSPALALVETPQGQARVARDEEELKALAFFRHGADPAVMGDDRRAARRLQALAEHPGLRLTYQEQPFESDSPMIEVPVERAWSDLRNQRYIFAGTEQTTRPHCLNWPRLQDDGRQSLLGVMVEIGASRAEASQVFVRGEGALPGMDERQSLQVLDRLHQQIQAGPNSDPSQDQDFFTSGWSYQTLARALEKYPAWRDAEPALERYVVSLGPTVAQRSFDNVRWAVHERDDAATLSAFFDVAAALGDHGAAREAFPFVEEKPWRAQLTTDVLPRLARAGVRGRERWPLLQEVVAMLEGNAQGGQVAAEAEKLLRLYDQLPAADPREVNRLYQRVEDQMRGGAWKDRSRAEILEGLASQVLFSQDADEVYRRLEASLRRADGPEGPGIERRGEDVYIGGVRVPTRGKA